MAESAIIVAVLKPSGLGVCIGLAPWRGGLQACQVRWIC